MEMAPNDGQSKMSCGNPHDIPCTEVIEQVSHEEMLRRATEFFGA